MTLSGACPCDGHEARFDQFEIEREVGVDLTNGRYADVQVLRCVACRQLWLTYAVEYADRSRSGRWARGQIDCGSVDAITPESATAYLHGLASYHSFGPLSEGEGRTSRSGPMRWDW